MSLLLFATFSSRAQFGFTPVRDPGVRGQMKRMVYQQWNDWKPDPRWHTVWYPPFWVPRNVEGSVFWGVLHRRYWKGTDRRPYRKDGPFVQNYVSLIAQKQQDLKIEDSMKRVYNTYLKTYISMSGGEADIAWTIYFKKAFNREMKDITSKMNNLALRFPRAFNSYTTNSRFKEYTQYLEGIKQRVHIVHQLFVGRGERILDYLKILNDLESHNRIMNEHIADAIFKSKYPTPEEEKKYENMPPAPGAKSDKDIVIQIMSNWKF
jgi:hypothetical protein